MCKFEVFNKRGKKILESVYKSKIAKLKLQVENMHIIIFISDMCF